MPIYVIAKESVYFQRNEFENRRFYVVEHKEAEGRTMDIKGVGAYNMQNHTEYKTQAHKFKFEKQLEEKRNEIYEKIKSGDTEQSFQIGASSFTLREWDKLISEVDEIMDDTRREMRKEHQQRQEKAEAKLES